MNGQALLNVDGRVFIPILMLLIPVLIYQVIQNVKLTLEGKDDEKEGVEIKRL